MTFPVNGVLDDFNRGNAGPPPSASWTTRGVGFSGASVSAGLVVNTNAATSSADDFGPAAWNTDFGADQEVYVTLTTMPQNGYGFQLGLRIQAGNEHYFAAFGRHDPAHDDVTIFKVNALYAWTVLSTISGDYIHDGDSYGFEVVGTALTVYHKPAAGAWGSILSAVDSSISAGGKIGLSSDGSVARLDNFGGGSLTSAPVADFSGTPLAGGIPLSVDFTDASTGSPTSWLWDFGDSTTSTDQNPTHIYTADGVYTVALTATNGDGSDTETKVDYITVSAPVADFSGTPTSGTVALSVNFTDASTNAPTSWFWDFGDGGSSTNQNPTYIYNYIGTYTVTLTASNGSGSDGETKVAYITVTAVVEYGAAVIENCDIDTGGASVGLRVADVAIARDNRFGSVTVDASAELRAKDNSYTTLVNNGTLQPLAGDRSAFDAIGYAARHTNDADDSVTAIHHTIGTGAAQAAPGNHTHAGAGTVTSIATGTGLTGGPITTSGTISDANTGVTAATYGDSSNIPQIAVNAQGRITSAVNMPIIPGAVNVYNETQTADGTSTIYYLVNYAAPSTIQVYIDGIRQPASDDTDPTDIVTFDVAPDLGALLLFDYEMDVT